MATTLTDVAARSIRVFDTAESLAVAVADNIVAAAADCVRAHGRFLWALSGGSTPRKVYEHLAQSPRRDVLPWDKAFVFFGDERAVPHDHPDSNFHMATEAMLSSVPIPREQVFPVVDPHVDAELAAMRYEKMIRTCWGADGIPILDLILLGIGEDGHTASLFPGTNALDENRRLVCAGHKDHSPRVTFTYPLINHAARVWFLVSGALKATILGRILSNIDNKLPAARVKPRDGQCVWWIDRPAASNLNEKYYIK